MEHLDGGVDFGASHDLLKSLKTSTDKYHLFDGNKAVNGSSGRCAIDGIKCTTAPSFLMTKVIQNSIYSVASVASGKGILTE